MLKSQTKNIIFNNFNIHIAKRNYSTPFLKTNFMAYKSNILSEKDFYIRRQNEMLISRIIKIATRPNKLLEPIKAVEIYNFVKITFLNGRRQNSSHKCRIPLSCRRFYGCRPRPQQSPGPQSCIYLLRTGKGAFDD